MKNFIKAIILVVIVVTVFIGGVHVSKVQDFNSKYQTSGIANTSIGPVDLDQLYDEEKAINPDCKQVYYNKTNDSITWVYSDNMVVSPEF